jgi:hypothetical protein
MKNATQPLAAPVRLNAIPLIKNIFFVGNGATVGAGLMRHEVFHADV